MTRKERLERLRLRLLESRDQLRASLRGDVVGGAGAGPAHGDEGDVATSCCTDELDSRIASHMSDELAEIEISLEKFKLGRYGVCEMTAVPIPMARLEALPFTRYTVEAQRILEEQGYDPRERRSSKGWARAVEHETSWNERQNEPAAIDMED